MIINRTHHEFAVVTQSHEPRPLKITDIITYPPLLPSQLILQATIIEK
jgi:hypothetical protein